MVVRKVQVDRAFVFGFAEENLLLGTVELGLTLQHVERVLDGPAAGRLLFHPVEPPR